LEEAAIGTGDGGVKNAVSTGLKSRGRSVPNNFAQIMDYALVVPCSRIHVTGAYERLAISDP